MKECISFLILIFFVTFPINSQLVNRKPLSPRVTGYKIKADLHAGSSVIYGEMEAFWVNSSQDIVPDVRLHLYLNAFRNTKSTFYKEFSGELPETEDQNGWIEILSISDDDGIDLAPSMSFISPDDGNPDDRTVLKIDLPEPAGPGDTVFLNVSFESKLPLLSFRTGYIDDYFFVAQWFPKFGVYEQAGMRYALTGGWNCHQFHAHSEFYSNHSVYDVKISVPENYIVGSCGLLMGTDEKEEGMKTFSFRAEDIVDFAWTAWPGYVEYTDKWNHVNITLLIPEERKNQVQRQLTAVKNALEYFDSHVGPYPWPHLTLVDPPLKGNGAGGMEYTTLFTSLSSDIMPSFIHFPEMVTIHEFGHAYFMGIMASNEFEEPWLDEGVNTFWEERIMDHYYGKSSGMIDLPFFKVADKTLSRFSYLMSENRQVVSNREYSWNYPHNTYSMMSYNKTATILFTLMGITGEETMNEIFREYYKKWAFRHPSGKDFIAVVNEVVTRLHGDKFGNDMNWFFDQTLYGTGLCDYKVEGFYNGRSSEADNDLTAEGGDLLYNAVVRLERPGEIVLPVEVLVHFENGNEVMEYWDGKERHKDYTYTNVPKVEWVKVDPDYKIPMDINQINNSMTSDPDRKPVSRFTNKMISFLLFFFNFISL